MTLLVYMYIYPVFGNGIAALVSGCSCPFKLSDRSLHAGDNFGDGESTHGRRLQTGPPPHQTNFCQKYLWTNLLYISNFYPNQLGANPSGDNGEGELGCMIQVRSAPALQFQL
eukprot:COSAG01_NODE_9793_length_2342_cov_9.890619_1_plen_113_part_00